MKPPTLVLLGSGELGKEVVISAKRLGCRVVAVDSYPGAPAMQVADVSEVISMLDGDALERVIRAHARPGKGFHVVPEIEAIRTERLLALEREGFDIVPSARAAHLTMNRDAIREVAATKLRLPTARFAYAESADELRAHVLGSIGLPCVVKPVMSSSGKGQSVVRTRPDIARAWDYACDNMRGDTRRVIAEEFIPFDYEITLLTVRQRPVVAGKRLAPARRTLFVRPIGHRQERGDYQESWMPCAMKPALVRQAQRMARAITDEIAGPRGAGLFGVEFFVNRGRVIFSELSPRPHDTGMVTMISQDLSEFDLHVRAILGLPIPTIRYEKAAASAVILADRESPNPPTYPGLDRALSIPGVQVRLFGKPSTRTYRRMGVALAVASTAPAARRLATRAAALVRIKTT
ncbi:MAG: formate-dependent phosphoribosylglycinamide formyltransferase [Phycisphaerales bacterium]